MRKVLVALGAAAMLLGACASEPVTGTAPETSRDKVLLEQGIQAFEAGNLPEAERLFAQILVESPKDPYANLNLGVIKAITNRENEALLHYEIAVEQGRQAPIAQVVNSNGVSESVTTNVAAVAAGNMERLKL